MTDKTDTPADLMVNLSMLENLLVFQNQSTAANIARDARDLIAQLNSPWQPISTAPKDGTWILAYGLDDQDCRRWGVIYWYEGRWLGGHFTSHGRPAHWMPLPTPPTPEETT